MRSIVYRNHIIHPCYIDCQLLGGRLNVRDASQTKRTLAELRLAALRNQMMHPVLLTISHQRKRTYMRCIRPVGGGLTVLECLLLAQQVCLRHVADRHVARVCCKAWLRRCRAEVVVRCA